MLALPDLRIGCSKFPSLSLAVGVRWLQPAPSKRRRGSAAPTGETRGAGELATPGWGHESHPLSRR
jgi:hypothetical protein